ncbi:MAG: hypothetical protein ABIK93_01045 [candidate division WOR-3 bacterium]
MEKVILILLSAPLMIYSAHVLIWEYDTLDIFYDPVLAESIDCPHWLKKALFDNGHTLEIYPYLPIDLTPYDVVFVTLGWFRC